MPSPRVDPAPPPGWPERLRRLLAALEVHPSDAVALAILAAGAVAALVLLWFLAGPSRPLPRAADDVLAAPAGLEVSSAEVVVHVTGQVAAPGVYELAAGTRVADALAAAGGPLPAAALDGLNLARPLSDGEQVVVPDAAWQSERGVAGATGGFPARRPDGTLDLNLATADDLEELPGVGPVLAERIIAHREGIGRFSEVGQLRDVPGIGEKTFQQLAPLVAV